MADDPPSVDDVGAPKAPPPKPSTHIGFLWSTEKAKTPSLEPWHAIFSSPNFPADRITVGLTNLIQLPRQMPVVGKECGAVNSFYTKRDPSITICYELADFFYKAFRSEKQSKKEAMMRTLYALMFIEIHEIGHALIGEFDLGVAGGEEEAVDDLAAVFSPATVAFDGANAMRALGKRHDKPAYFDEHPVGEQRFYNIYCVIYGSDPATWASLVDNPLPASRAPLCADEFRRKKKFWAQQLEAHGWKP